MLLTTTPASIGITFGELVFGLCWAPSLALPFYYGLHLKNRPTARDLLTPFPSGDWFRFSIKLLLPIELGLGLAATLGFDDRVPVVVKLPVWLVIAGTTWLAVRRGFRMRPREPGAGGRSTDGANQLPGYEQAYAQTIARLEDSLAVGPPAATGRKARRRPKRRHAP